MRFSTVVISSAFVFAGMSAAYSFADSDFEVEARAFDEPKLYARGGAMSRLRGDRNRDNNDRPPSYHHAAQDPPPRYQSSPNHLPHLDPFQRETDYSNNHKSPAYTSTHRHRRSYDELVARGGALSKIGGGGGGGDKERKDGRPPKYKVAQNDPPPRYQGSPNHIPHLDSFQRETDYTHNHKSPTHHRRSFYDLD